MSSIIAASQSFNPILPSTNELIYSVLSFGILFFFLAKFAYPPIKVMMANRTAKIQGDLDAASNARTDAERTLAEYREQLNEAKKEAARIVEEARHTAEVLRRDLLAKAEEEAVELRARNEEALRIERERVASELRAEMASLSLEIAEKVIKAEIDKGAASLLVDQFINEIEAARP
ncbi:MAG: F0F1 ATP synthase subunit B [Actinomycetota bacterium]|nr:F0F1 ATP synthase subunit B [Actinomycetota bacterium]